RTGAVTTQAYDPVTGQLSSITDGESNPTSYDYYSSSHKNAGLVREVKNALNKSGYQAYDDAGRPTETWGAAPYPSKRTYPVYGELHTLSTYRGGSGWDASTWPASPGTADTTTWQYATPTGLLMKKTDAQSHEVIYTWHDSGSIRTRQTERFTTTWTC